MTFLFRNEANQFGEERGSYKPFKVSAPHTCAGALRSLRETRVFCRECGTIERVADVLAVVQTSTSYISDALLDCGHRREIVVNVRRTK